MYQMASRLPLEQPAGHRDTQARLQLRSLAILTLLQEQGLSPPALVAKHMGRDKPCSYSYLLRLLSLKLIVYLRGA